MEQALVLIFNTAKSAAAPTLLVTGIMLNDPILWGIGGALTAWDNVTTLLSGNYYYNMVAALAGTGTYAFMKYGLPGCG